MTKLNPGYKLLTLILASLLLSTTYSTTLNMLVALTALTVTFLTPGVNRRRLTLALLPFLLTAAGMFMTGLFFSSPGEAEIAVRVVDQRTLYATSWHALCFHNEFHGTGYESHAAVPPSAQIRLWHSGGLSFLSYDSKRICNRWRSVKGTGDKGFCIFPKKDLPYAGPCPGALRKPGYGYGVPGL